MLREIYVRPVGLFPAAQGERAETVLGGLRLAGGWLDFSAIEVIERNGSRLDRRLAGLTDFLERDWGRRTFYMQCGFHAYMESWAMAVNNPYYALTDKDGKFTIDQVPPGTYQMVVWHPQTGNGTTKQVTVKADGMLVEHLSLPAPKGNRTAYKVMDNPRFGPESLGYSIEIHPLVEHQQ